MAHPPETETTEYQLTPELALELELANLKQELERRNAAGLETVLFIPITGGEGCGKTTLMKNLENLLNQIGIANDKVKMLGGNPVSDQIRAIILDRAVTNFSATVNVRLLQASIASAAQQLREMALAAQGQPTVIFGDRSPYDTAVYQILAEAHEYGVTWERSHDITQENLAAFNEMGVEPTFTIYIKLDPAIGLARKHSQGELNRFEEKTVAFHRKVATGFDHFAGNRRGQIVTLEGQLTPVELQLETLRRVNDFLSAHPTEGILGQPVTVENLTGWYREPSMLQRLFSLRLVETFGEAMTYLKTLHKISIWLRDDDAPMAQRVAVWQQIEAGMRQSVDIFRLIDAFMRDSHSFNLVLNNLSPEEMVEDGWRYWYTIQDEVDHVMRGIGSRTNSEDEWTFRAPNIDPPREEQAE